MGSYKDMGSLGFLPPRLLPFGKIILPPNFNHTTAIRSTNNTPSSSKYLRARCMGRNWEEGGPISSASSAYEVLGVEPGCSATELKAAFRAKVKRFHPDVNGGGNKCENTILRVIQAYEMLTKLSRSDIIERECLDPFDKPECEALDIFVNEVLCVGKGCPYSCVKTAPHVFTFASSTFTARAISQEHGKDYQVQLAASQCPRSCIHYVTPSQRIILEELLDSIIETPYDTSAEEDLLYSLIVKARFENNRFQKPKKQPKSSTQNVDWF